MADKGCPIVEGCQVIIESPTVNRIWCRACSLHDKKYFCEFRKRVDVLQPFPKVQYSIPTQLSILFTVAVKSGCRGCLVSSSYLYNIIDVLGISILPLSTIYLLDFGNVRTVWYFLEMFGQCGIFWEMFGQCGIFGNIRTVWYFLEMFGQCVMFWKCSDSVVFFGPVPTVWYVIVFLEYGPFPTVWYVFVFLEYGPVPTVWYMFLFF